MTEEHELPSESDEDDEDYVPDGVEDAVSEAESEGEAESEPEDENDENRRNKSEKKGKKRSRNSKCAKNKKKKTLEIEEKDAIEQDDETKTQLTEEEEKKRADSLWADFMKDTGTTPEAKPNNSTNGSREKSPPLDKSKIQEKIKITKVYEFAGEEVKIEKEVAKDSLEARLSLSSSENSTKSRTPVVKKGRIMTPTGLGGISSILGQLGKKAKISTLEKSKLDWDSYKKQENLEEEINTHNKGKDGYLERQDFLQRADLRQFEIEKQLRKTTRRNTR